MLRPTISEGRERGTSRPLVREGVAEVSQQPNTERWMATAREDWGQGLLTEGKLECGSVMLETAARARSLTGHCGKEGKLDSGSLGKPMVGFKQCTLWLCWGERGQ